jgi:hypothetical protein
VSDEQLSVLEGPALDKLLSDIQRKLDVLSLLGKDYLDEIEAAHYACVSPSNFREKAARHNILPVRFMGKKVYRRVDIQRAIEKEWRRFEKEQ